MGGDAKYKRIRGICRIQHEEGRAGMSNKTETIRQDESRGLNPVKNREPRLVFLCNPPSIINKEMY